LRKIPTIFERDWNGDRSRVVDQINPEAAWVFNGEGIATRKIDGTCCLIRGGKLFKRREITERDLADRVPEGFESADRDAATGKVVGWVPVTDAPEDRWHLEAFDPTMPDGTYELVGPKVQGNPEHSAFHVLVAHHGDSLLMGEGPERTFDGIRTYIDGKDLEGIVFHHPDGRMAKIKGRDFGFKRKAHAAAA